MTHQPLSLEHLQQENEQLRAQLIELQRTSALGELLGTTTHEFNNVLMTVLNYAKLGLRNPDTESRNKAFNKILQAAQRASDISRSVLGMARNRKPDFESTQLADLVRESLLLLERELQKYRIQVELDLREVPPVPVVANQIQQVLLNLLTNARQAMPQGGRLLIRLARDEAAHTVDLVVRDTGVGIPADQLPQIFQPYFTTKCGPDATGKGGTGLGLCACRQIVVAHQGKIRVESTVGQGTAFTIKLPLVRQSEASVATATPAASPPVAPVRGAKGERVVAGEPAVTEERGATAEATSAPLVPARRRGTARVLAPNLSTVRPEVTPGTNPKV